MADKTKQMLNQLLAGQHKLEADVTGLKEGQKLLEADVAELKEGQSILKADVSELKAGQSILKADVSKLEADVSELKEGQKRMEHFLLNMENRIMPIINATYENSKLNKEQIESIRETQSKHSDKLENHELRILRLEHSNQ